MARDGSIQSATSRDPSHCTGDLLVGADGAGSCVRKQLLPHARHEETGILSLGGSFQ